MSLTAARKGEIVAVNSECLGEAGVEKKWELVVVAGAKASV